MMNKEIYRIIPENIDHTEGHSLSGILSLLRGLKQQEQWSLIEQEIEKAADLINQEKSVLFFLVDETTAGGPHAVQALYNPREKKVQLEIPKEPLQKGGRFPTVLHALEVIAGTTGLTNQKNIYPHHALSYPEVNFVQGLGEPAKKPELILIPLTVVDTNKANVVAFHPQARHINPEALAQAYYKVIQTDNELPEDMIRHTLLVQELPEKRPSNKHIVTISVLPKEATHSYKLMNLGRIARWLDPTATENLTVRRA